MLAACLTHYRKLRDPVGAILDLKGTLITAGEQTLAEGPVVGVKAGRARMLSWHSQTSLSYLPCIGRGRQACILVPTHSLCWQVLASCRCYKPETSAAASCANPTPPPSVAPAQLPVVVFSKTHDYVTHKQLPPLSAPSLEIEFAHRIRNRGSHVILKIWSWRQLEIQARGRGELGRGMCRHGVPVMCLSCRARNGVRLSVADILCGSSPELPT